MTTTPNLGLTQYAGTDTMNFLTQYNTDLDKIDTTTGKLSNLTTASKTNLVSATNENVTNIGTLASLTTTSKTNLVSATNENVTNIGTLASLTTTSKTNLVSAVNEINNNLKPVLILDRTLVYNEAYTFLNSHTLSEFNKIIIEIGPNSTVFSGNQFSNLENRLVGKTIVASQFGAPNYYISVGIAFSNTVIGIPDAIGISGYTANYCTIWGIK